MTASASDMTNTSTLAVDRQREAIEISGWGKPFRSVQPRNLAFWVFLTLTAVGLFQIWSYFRGSVAFYAEPFIVAAVLCLLCGAAWAGWFHHIDRWERQPAGLVVAALAWGAIPATFAFALPVNSAMLGIYPKLFGQDWASSWAAGLTAPFTEETAKLCGLILLLALAPRLIRTANDGLIVGAFIGLGFAVFEDFLYAANATMTSFSSNPDSAAVTISLTRIATSAVSHPLFSALVCSGAIYLIGTAAQPRRILRGVLFILAGMFLHFTWDDASGLGGNNGLGIIAVMAGSIVLALVILTIAFRMAAPREHEFVRDLLAPEVESGAVTAEEVEALVDRKARKAWLREAPTHRARSARKHLRHSLFDLCHEIARAERAETPDLAHARSEVARLRERTQD
ncbi:MULTISPECIES: PrsW family intramembrane metalloprotease [unclassified Microbacterium]|uniref:PrsW family intramembrane metalloprotease n=1 Tax=unclassified Microbacterium TaxID=2609290 RepID=UPI003018F326